MKIVPKRATDEMWAASGPDSPAWDDMVEAAPPIPDALIEAVGATALAELRGRKGFRHLIEGLEIDDEDLLAEIRKSIGADIIKAIEEFDG